MLSLLIYIWNQSINVISTSIYRDKKMILILLLTQDTQPFFGLCTFFYYGLTVSLPNSYIETIFLTAMLLGDETIGRLIRIRWGHDFGALLNGGKSEKRTCFLPPLCPVRIQWEFQSATWKRALTRTWPCFQPSGLCK